MKERNFGDDFDDFGLKHANISILLSALVLPFFQALKIRPKTNQAGI